MKPSVKDDPLSTDAVLYGCLPIAFALLVVVGIAISLSDRSLDRTLPVLAAIAFLGAGAATFAYRRSEADRRRLRLGDVGFGVLLVVLIGLGALSSIRGARQEALAETVAAIAGILVLGVYLFGVWGVLKLIMPPEVPGPDSRHQARWRWVAVVAGFFFALLEFMILARGAR